MGEEREVAGHPFGVEGQVDTSGVGSVSGQGGMAKPQIELLVPATLCNLQEVTDGLPEGTVVSYSVDGGPPTTETSGTAPPVVAPHPVPPAPCAPTGQLPATGAPAVPEILLVSAALVIVGVLARRGSAWGQTRR